MIFSFHIHNDVDDFFLSNGIFEGYSTILTINFGKINSIIIYRIFRVFIIFLIYEDLTSIERNNDPGDNARFCAIKIICCNLERRVLREERNEI